MYRVFVSSSILLSYLHLHVCNFTELLVLDQKYMKIEAEINKYKKDEINTIRTIHDLQKKLVTLNQQCSEKKNYKDFLDNENFAAQNQLICDLKVRLFVFSSVIIQV